MPLKIEPKRGFAVVVADAMIVNSIHDTKRGAMISWLKHDAGVDSVVARLDDHTEGELTVLFDAVNATLEPDKVASIIAVELSAL